ncbi:prostaglandin D2 receptor 2-like [Archocentrus centrarchus]|uniref:prostaglandin D2 receptor 2-like n=1 Tax=Archocentrus centrarchus TaxID=63155 RepID=UPI0011EA0AB0|nr:prostaglandin D2 receptor 2-like [Archocentrus centrarchus]
MSNMSLESNIPEEQVFCPQLEKMREHVLINNTQVNMAVVCIHGLVSGLGILENALIIWVVGFRLRQRTVASIWVLNLALSDFLATLTLPLFTLYLNSRHSWELGNPLCKVQTSIFFINMFVSAFLLAAISLDRLLLVTKPVWSQNHRSVAGAWKVCILGWLWAAVNSLPYYIFRSVTETKHTRKLCYHNFAMYLSSNATLETECNVRQWTTAMSKLLLAFLFPLAVIAGSYIKICLSLRSRNRRRKQSTCRLTDDLIMSDRNQESGTKKGRTITTKMISLKLLTPSPALTTKEGPLTPTTPNLTNQSQLSQSFSKMVTSVIAAFALCWAPYHIFCMIEVAAQYKEECLKLVEGATPSYNIGILKSNIKPHPLCLQLPTLLRENTAESGSSV